MESIELQLEPRTAVGKGASRKLRNAGRLPAVLYGPKRQAVPVALEAKGLDLKAISARRTLLVRLRSASLDVGGGLALVKDVQRHPVTGKILHADLYEVDVQSKLRVQVPLEFYGKAVGVERGGILQPLLREVEVLCFPTDIPDAIRVDVSRLDIHGVLHLSDVSVPPGVEVQYDSDDAVVTVLAPAVEEVKVEAQAPPEEGTAPAEAAAVASAQPKSERKG